MKSITDRARALRDRATLKRDTSPEAAAGIRRTDLDQCGFTQAEIDAAPPVEVVDVDEDE